MKYCRMLKFLLIAFTPIFVASLHSKFENVIRVSTESKKKKEHEQCEQNILEILLLFRNI